MPKNSKKQKYFFCIFWTMKISDFGRTMDNGLVFIRRLGGKFLSLLLECLWSFIGLFIGFWNTIQILGFYQKIMEESADLIDSEEECSICNSQIKTIPTKFITNLNILSSSSLHFFPTQKQQPTQLQCLNLSPKLEPCPKSKFSRVFMARETQKKNMEAESQSELTMSSEISVRIRRPLEYKEVDVKSGIRQRAWRIRKLHGHAKVNYQNGLFFEGRFENGRKMEGLMVFQDGSQYRGAFKNNLFHGKGTVTDASGRKIMGIWANGFVEGDVTIIYESGQVYKGQVKNLKKHGKGKLWLRNNYEYIGQFRDGMINGYGRYCHKGMTIAQGDWQEGILIAETPKAVY